MDLAVILFSICLLLVGVWLVFRFSHSSPDAPRLPPRTSVKPQALKTANQMKRQRLRVWWKVDKLYAEFIERTGTAKHDRAVPTPQSSSTMLAAKEQADACEHLTPAKINEAFEDFLRKTP